jgi:thiol-disulfide isomerase/thioredoxin
LQFKDGILQVYGSNFISIVRERKYAPADANKALILMFTKQDCPKCEWNEAYFDRLAKEFATDDFVFAKMDLDKNYPTSDLRQFLYNYGSDEPMLQFLAVLPDGGTVNRFQKEAESYEELTKFIESAKYLVNLNKPRLVEAETVANTTEGVKSDEL